MCEALCDDLVCVVNEQLCDTAAEAETYNQCIAPDLATAQCSAATSSGLSHSAGAPVIVDVGYQGANADPLCDDNLQTYVATVYAPSGLLEADGDDADFNRSLSLFSSSGGDSNYLWAPPTVSTNGSLALVTFQICLQAGGTVALVNANTDLPMGDTSGMTSNLFCLDVPGG